MCYLIKSLYKTGLECPNKLFYTKNKQYANTKNDGSCYSLANCNLRVC